VFSWFYTKLSPGDKRRGAVDGSWLTVASPDGWQMANGAVLGSETVDHLFHCVDTQPHIAPFLLSRTPFMSKAELHVAVRRAILHGITAWRRNPPALTDALPPDRDPSASPIDCAIDSQRDIRWGLLFRGFIFVQWLNFHEFQQASQINILTYNRYGRGYIPSHLKLVLLVVRRESH
jgi:hypothetical protein